MIHAKLVRLTITTTLLLSALLVSSSATAQTKFAVVDMQRAVMETEDGLRAAATIKKLFDKRQEELNSRQDQLERARSDIEKQSKVLSKEALQRRSEEWQRSMMELQGVFVEFNNELQKKQSELTQPILNRVLSVLRQIASQDGYDAIFERNAVPFARTDLDITDRVIQRYNASSSTGGEQTGSGGGAKKGSAAPAPAPARSTK